MFSLKISERIKDTSIQFDIIHFYCILILLNSILVFEWVRLLGFIARQNKLLNWVLDLVIKKALHCLSFIIDRILISCLSIFLLLTAKILIINIFNL